MIGNADGNETVGDDALNIAVEHHDEFGRRLTWSSKRVARIDVQDDERLGEPSERAPAETHEQFVRTVRGERWLRRLGGRDACARHTSDPTGAAEVACVTWRWIGRRMTRAGRRMARLFASVDGAGGVSSTSSSKGVGGISGRPILDEPWQEQPFDFDFPE